METTVAEAKQDMLWCMRGVGTSMGVERASSGALATTRTSRLHCQTTEMKIVIVVVRMKLRIISLARWIWLEEKGLDLN
jgi:hypothetical protein